MDSAAAAPPSELEATLPPNAPEWMRSAPAAAAAESDPQAAAAAAAAARDIAKLQGQVEAYQAMQQAGAAPAAQPTHAQDEAVQRLLDIDVEDLTPEEMETYQSSIPVMEKVMRRALMQHVDPALATLRDQANAVQQSVATTAATTFDATLNATVPDLQELARNPHFVRFTEQPIPYTGGKETVRTRLKAAYDAQDTTTISGIMSEFRQGIQSVAPDTANPPVAAFAVPQSSPPSNPVPRPAAQTSASTQAPMLKMSKRVEASEMLRKGRINRAQLDEIDAVYTKAFAENRVDMNS